MGRFGPENNLLFSINSPGQGFSCYLRVGRDAKVLARAYSMPVVYFTDRRFSISEFRTRGDQR